MVQLNRCASTAHRMHCELTQRRQRAPAGGASSVRSAFWAVVRELRLLAHRLISPNRCCTHGLWRLSPSG